MFPLNQYDFFELDHQERLRAAEQHRLVMLVMEGRPRRPGIISRWMAALRTLAKLRVIAPIPHLDRPVVMMHDSGVYRTR